jgi:hypothetical protein
MGNQSYDLPDPPSAISDVGSRHNVVLPQYDELDMTAPARKLEEREKSPYVNLIEIQEQSSPYVNLIEIQEKQMTK